MAESTPPDSLLFQRNLIQLKRKSITAHGNSIVIRKGRECKEDKKKIEKQIFSKSKIQFLMSLGEENDGKALFLAVSSKRIALFQLMKESPIAIFKLDETSVDHGTVRVLEMGRKKEGEFRVKLIILELWNSGTVRKMQLSVHFGEAQVTKQKMKCLDEIRMENEQMKFFVNLGNDNFFCFYEDTVVKSDGLFTRAEEPSIKKKRRIAVVGRELWHGNILLTTENGTIRVVRMKNDRNNSSDTLTLFSEGQCVPPYCTLRCREPSVIISSENTVIVGTQRGEIHFLNERLELISKIDTEGGPINCLKVDENDTEFLWVGFESGELRMLFMPDSDHIDDGSFDARMNSESQNFIEERKRSNGDDIPRKAPRKDKTRGGNCGKSKSELRCLEMGCFYKTFSVYAFIKHLKFKHRTNLSLAGLALRCQCGNESISDTHSTTCIVSDFAIVRKNDFGPIRTFADTMYPKCTLCEAYPKTISGYAQHLHKEHNRITLVEIGFLLKCGVCNGLFNNLKRCQDHSRKCKSRFYTLVKLGEEGEKNNNTEMDQTVDA